VNQYKVSILFLVLSVLCFYYKGIPQLEEKTYRCKVLGKTQTNATGKIPAYFILALEVDDRVIDLSVAPGIYMLAKNGDIISFNLSERHFVDNWAAGWVILSIILLFIAFMNFIGEKYFK